MGKILPIIASLLLLRGTAAFADPSFTLESRTEDNTTALTVKTDDNSIFHFEDFGRTGEPSKVTEWTSDELTVATTYQKGEIPPTEKAFFKDVVKGYLTKETDKFFSIFRNHPQTLSFYTPLGTEKGNGRFILYFGGTKFALYEGDKGTLSFYEGVPSHRFGERNIDLVNVEGIGNDSAMYLF
jgi:hypothetical protein